MNSRREIAPALNSNILDVALAGIQDVTTE